VHGTQEQAFFNGYYDHERLLVHLLTPCVGSQTASIECRPSRRCVIRELQRLIAQIRTHWPVTIVVRGDSAYGREEIMSWCEAQPNVEYVLAFPSNERLRTLPGDWNNEPRWLTSNEAKEA